MPCVALIAAVMKQREVIGVTVEVICHIELILSFPDLRSLVVFT